MDNDSNDQSAETALSIATKNGEIPPIMANYPEIQITPVNNKSHTAKTLKVNGDANYELEEGSDINDSSDSDALVIDESVKNDLNKTKRKRPFNKLKNYGFKGFKKSKSEVDSENPSNPYFAESLFELSELHRISNCLKKSLEKEYSKSEDRNRTAASPSTEGKTITPDATVCINKDCNRKNKKCASPKLREYAQYLGLQPKVQFKCSKCGQAGFQSLVSLNEHHPQCNAQAPIVPFPTTSTQTTGTPSTNLKITRKVFLCSACGTYYENWNLFLHMREVHKRFICLYCLGMFSQPEKLSVHLVSKHNCVPGNFNSVEDFFQSYKDPCFLMCCNCEKVFNERDNFFDHNCVERTNKPPDQTKSKINTSGSFNKNPGNQKQSNTKSVKHLKQKGFIEHITADTPVNTANMSNKITEKSTQDNVDDESVSAAKNNEEIGGVDCNSKSDADSVSSMETKSETIDKVTNLDTDDIAQESDHCIENRDEFINQQDANLVKLENEEVLEISKDYEDAEIEEEADEPQLNVEDDNFLVEENSSKKNYSSDDSNFPEETRKVPKVTLKLPKSVVYSDEQYESDDSDKLTMEMDQIESDSGNLGIPSNDDRDEVKNTEILPQIAGADIPIVELELEQPLDKFDIRLLLQKCLTATIPNCVYCNHARKIAVNGKNLGLHAIAEHRFSAVVNSITAEELIPESFVAKIKECLPDIQDVYFSLESTSPTEAVSFSHVFECFQCRYSTPVHKELYLHNRKMHAKTILLCIMCKSNFYSYSELICHLCPGIYAFNNNDVSFRCCMCVSDELPSAFRLMVHLRKRHHACDVCFELCHNQSRLSNHVWKHKLHHLCYRCGIAYRNKPDITKHLFWKHGTESVLCKKCLQKKWPHVYHFCIPPTTFTCEECNLIFTRAVSLKVHKRLHGDDRPHVCTFEGCLEKFVSKKLLLKHEFKHREPPEEIGQIQEITKNLDANADSVQTCIENKDIAKESPEEIKIEEIEEKVKSKPQIDVYDLPALNLSESDSSDSEDEAQKKLEEKKSDLPMECGNLTDLSNTADVLTNLESTTLSDAPNKPTPVIETIWDDFKNYQANKVKLDNVTSELVKSEPLSELLEEKQVLLDVILNDHDYCIVPNHSKEPAAVRPSHIEITQSLDHDYCSPTDSKHRAPQQIDQKQLRNKSEAKVSKKRNEAKHLSSDSSSDSDSSSCTCGSNCSCSSSSNSSSSTTESSESDSSTSEGRKRQQARREKRKERTKLRKGNEKKNVDVVTTDNQPAIQVDIPLQESDLDTTETETDEDFYDKQPQKLANKLLEEKRNQLLLLAGISPLINGAMLESSRPSTPSLPEIEETKPKKKSKSKKRKKKSKRREESSQNRNISSVGYEYYQPLTVAPLTLSLPRNSPLTISMSNPGTPPINDTASINADQSFLSGGYSESDASIRASKRRRVPNKFYGYSSDEDQEKSHQPPVLKWRKADLPSPIRQVNNAPLVVPPITIKTAQSPAPPTVEPLSIRTASQTGELRVQQARQLLPRSYQLYQQYQPTPPLQPQNIAQIPQEQDSGTESNESSSEEEHPLMRPNNPPLYCYCRCPYDEVSEMIGCDSSNCEIEWFHFECVGIMVPPKGQWFCPDCRKKKQQRKELLQTQ